MCRARQPGTTNLVCREDAAVATYASDQVIGDAPAEEDTARIDFSVVASVRSEQPPAATAATRPVWWSNVVAWDNAGRDDDSSEAPTAR